MASPDAESAFVSAARHLREYRPAEAVRLFRGAASGFANAGDEHGEAAALHGEALALGRMGRAAEAIPKLSVALEVLERLGVPEAFNVALDLGRLFEDVGRSDQALGIYQHLRETSAAAGDVGKRAMANNAVGRALTDLERYDEAVDAFEAALALRIEAGDLRGEGVTRGGLGSALFALDRHDEAASHLRLSVSIACRRGDRREEAVSRGELARVLRAMGQLAEALQAARDALAASRERDDVLELADKMALMADMLLGDDDESAIALFDEAIAIFASAKLKDRHAALLGRSQAALIALGRAGEAVERAHHEADLHTDLGNDEARAHALIRAADGLRDLGRAEESLAVADRVVREASAAGHATIEAEARITRGLALEVTGRLPEALEDHRTARDVASDLCLANLEYIATSSMSRALRLAGELTAAVEMAEEALALGQAHLAELGDAEGVGRVDGDLANLHVEVARAYEALERVGPALEHFDRAIDTRDRYVRAAALCSMASLVARVGRHADGVALATEGLVEAREIGATQTEAVALDLLGTLANRSDRATAIQHHLDAAHLFSAINNRQGEGAAVHNAAALMSDDERALPLLRRALHIAEETGDLVGGSACWLSIGNALLRGDAIDEALDAHLTAVRSARKAGHRRLELVALTQAAHAMLRLARADEASGLLVEALAALDSLRVDALLPEFRQVLVADTRETFALMVGCLSALAAEAGHVEREQYLARAFAVSEQARARALTQAWTEGRLVQGRRGSVDDAAREERLELEARLRDLVRRQRAADAPVSTELAEQIRTIERRQRLLDVRYRESLETAGTPEPVFSAVRITDLRTALLVGRRTVLLEYLLGHHASYLIAVSADRIEVHRIDDRDTVERLCVDHHAALATAQQRGTRTAALYDALLSPVEGMLDAADQLIVVPDGALHAVAWQALEHDGRRVIDRFTVRSAPSATLAVAATGPRDSAGLGGLVAFGDPVGSGSRLRHSAREVSVIGRMFDPLVPEVAVGDADPRGIVYASRDSNVVVRTREHATKQAFLDAVQNGDGTRNIHVATHGFVDSERPQLSGLAFSPTGEGEPNLHAFEVAELSLACELCVLSACETGAGRLVHGEGLLGLWRAFAIAGARTLCATLWRVEDRASSELLVSLYEHLHAGLDISAALRSAQLRTAEKYSHPYFWAGFQVVL
jgi:CHAT domain-containing protein